MNYKLILHFDINQTIIADDISNNKEIEDGILSCLADEVIVESKTYKQYCESIYPGISKENKELRKKMIRDNLLNLSSESQRKKYFLAKQNASDSLIVKSFAKLIDFLKTNNIDFLLHLRTFGDDLDKVQSCVEKLLGAKMKYIETKNFTPFELSQLFKSQHCAVKDDYNNWITHNKNCKYGKIFPLPQDEFVLCSFFDDNAYCNIISPMYITNDSIVYQNPLPLITKAIHNVSILLALVNDDYFVDLLRPTLSFHKLI